MKIGLRLAWRNNQGHTNWIGDDTLAMGWQKYLIRAGHDCEVVGPDPFSSLRDVVIHFHPGLIRSPQVKTLLYCQNVWPEDQFPGGTMGVYSSAFKNYDGGLFASETLRLAASEYSFPGITIPFAADPELFNPQFDETYAHPITFVGNDIRGEASNEKYLIPAIARGLVVYGGPFRDPRIQAVHRGRIPQDELPKVYSSSQLNLNFTHPMANAYGIVAMRAYEVMMCGGKLESDVEPFPNGWRKEEHTWARRVSMLISHLEKIL